MPLRGGASGCQPAGVEGSRWGAGSVQTVTWGPVLVLGAGQSGSQQAAVLSTTQTLKLQNAARVTQRAKLDCHRHPRHHTHTSTHIRRAAGCKDASHALPCLACLWCPPSLLPTPSPLPQGRLPLPTTKSTVDNSLAARVLGVGNTPLTCPQGCVWYCSCSDTPHHLLHDWHPSWLILRPGRSIGL